MLVCNNCLTKSECYDYESTDMFGKCDECNSDAMLYETDPIDDFYDDEDGAYTEDDEW